MIIKVCGMRDGGNISEAIEAGADWIGMIFWPNRLGMCRWCRR